MFKQAFETSPTPHVTVAECLGNLVVRGAEEERIAIRVPGDADDVTIDREGETFTITTRSDCTLTCPRATTLTVDAVQGNLKVEGVDGPVAIGTVHGNANLRAVGPAAVEQVFGNLRVRQAAGDLRAHTVRGNARVRGIEGSLSLGQVDGNLVAEELRAGLEAERVHGNARLEPLVSPGLNYRLNADGNLTLHVPADASLRLALSARGGVRSSIPGLVLEETEGQMRGTLGAGEASLEAQVGGHASLRPLEPEYRPGEELDLGDLEGLGAQIEARVAEAMSELEAHLHESLGRIDSAEVRRRVERVAEKARRSAEREAERARLRAERAERRWRRASGHRARPRRTPATDEERMRVLRLVEEGKVTPEQAADLLSALEGR
jgi:hypothetical protein